MTASSSDYIVLNDTLIVKNESGKDVEGNGHGLLHGIILAFA
jgi:hypothetical protein